MGLRGAVFAVAVTLACVLSPGAASAQRRPAIDPGAPPVWVTPAVEAPRVTQRTFESRAAGTTVSWFVYVPAVYDSTPDRRFPVLYWLHGTGGGLHGVAPVAARFDAAIRAGLVPPMLVVFPNGLQTSMWVDSKDGRVPMETLVVRELVPLVDATYRTIAAREARILEGFSMGGYGAARLGFKYPGLFGAVSVLAGGPLQREFTFAPRASEEMRRRVLETTYGGDMAYFREQSPWALAERNAAALRGARLRVVVGARDTMLAVTREFAAHLERLGVPHTFDVVDGVDHEALPLLRGLGERCWNWYREALAGTPAPDAEGVKR